MSHHSSYTNPKRIIETIEKREGKPILELFRLQNERMEAKERAKLTKERENRVIAQAKLVKKSKRQSVRSTNPRPPQSLVIPSASRKIVKQQYSCRCGASCKRFFNDDRFVIVCNRSNRAPKNCPIEPVSHSSSI